MVHRSSHGVSLGVECEQYGFRSGMASYRLAGCTRVKIAEEHTCTTACRVPRKLRSSRVNVQPSVCVYSAPLAVCRAADRLSVIRSQWETTSKMSHQPKMLDGDKSQDLQSNTHYLFFPGAMASPAVPEALVEMEVSGSKRKETQVQIQKRAAIVALGTSRCL